MKVLVYPTFNNPYQNFLYSNLSSYHNIEYNYFDNYLYKKHVSLGLLLMPLRLILFRLKGYTIFHLHWQDFVVPFPIHTIQLSLSTLYALFFIFYIKVLGYKLIWTIHNIVPHEQKYLNDHLITKCIAFMSNAKIVHSKQTIDELTSKRINTTNVSVIQHPSYIDVYPNTVNSIEARKRFDMDDHDIVFLFLGIIRKYKGLENLLTAFELLSYKYKKIKLIVAGSCYDQEIESKITTYALKLSKRLLPFLKHVEDTEIQYYMNSANVVVMPFIRLTTSGSANLAMSFKKPIIYPDMGSLHDLSNVGFKYDPMEADGLQQAMESSILNKQKLEEFGENGYSTVKDRTWKKMSDETVEVYKNALVT